MANEDERVYFAKLTATPEEVEHADQWLSCRFRGSTVFDKLAEANKKQIPVKVDITDSCWRCPVCGMELHGTRYCPDCGQALDWGNDE